MRKMHSIPLEWIDVTPGEILLLVWQCSVSEIRHEASLLYCWCLICQASLTVFVTSLPTWRPQLFTNGLYFVNKLYCSIILAGCYPVQPFCPHSFWLNLKENLWRGSIDHVQLTLKSFYIPIGDGYLFLQMHCITFWRLLSASWDSNQWNHS